MKEIQLSVASVVCFVLFRVCNMWRVNSNNLRCSTKTPEVCNFLLWSLISVLCLHVDVLVDVCDGSQCLRGQEQLKGLAVNRPPWPRLPRWLMCPRQRSCPGLLCKRKTRAPLTVPQRTSFVLFARNTSNNKSSKFTASIYYKRYFMTSRPSLYPMFLFFGPSIKLRQLFVLCRIFECQSLSHKHVSCTRIWSHSQRDRSDLLWEYGGIRAHCQAIPSPYSCSESSGPLPAVSLVSCRCQTHLRSEPLFPGAVEGWSASTSMASCLCLLMMWFFWLIWKISSSSHRAVSSWAWSDGNDSGSGVIGGGIGVCSD